MHWAYIRRKLGREASAEQFSWNYLSSLCKKLNPREFMHPHGFVFTYVCTNLPKLCNYNKLCWHIYSYISKFLYQIYMYIYIFRFVYIPYASPSWLDFKTSVGQILSSKHLGLVSAKTIKGTQSTENDLVNCSQTVCFHEVTSFKGLRIERTSRCLQMHLKL